MCLITEQLRPIKIRKDLTVFKVVTKEINGFSPWNEYYEFDYRLNTLYTESIGADNIPDSYADQIVIENYPYWRSEELTHVHSGFHSALTIDRISNFCGWENTVRVKCIIPKGSLIYKDKTGLIVSNKIILKEVL